MDARERIVRLQQQTPLILPSLLLCDFGNLQSEVEKLERAGIQALHLDVMDGQFVPNLTYGFPIVEALRQVTELPLDVHLMIDSPQRYIERFREAGADCMTVHVEAVAEPAAVLEQIHRTGAAAGIAINPDTPMDRLGDCLDQCDLVLVMSVQAGFGGQSFRHEALSRLKQLRQQVASQVLLEVDGGINRETIGPCAAAGAELLVVGSAIFGQPDYGQAIQMLQQRARHAEA